VCQNLKENSGSKGLKVIRKIKSALKLRILNNTSRLLVISTELRYEIPLCNFMGRYHFFWSLVLRGMCILSAGLQYSFVTVCDLSQISDYVHGFKVVVEE
jgi:hypothetical protein